MIHQHMKALFHTGCSSSSLLPAQLQSSLKLEPAGQQKLLSEPRPIRAFASAVPGAMCLLEGSPATLAQVPFSMA